ncbi:MAG TPA: XRE family transcriptional regulator [Aurantimonas coralicida]|uniref:XRE family transcriptional regulator n=2 Tax=root TaxID=1 RepID=A0A9C9NDK3_9HYPH|nr:XRE family transcriptional regulator [Aurantimonas coralicida]HET99630.1 XRE family transcriptional regulator [Aurantimonas coralicida]
MASEGELLKHYRELRGLSQQKLAEFVGTSNQQISRLELGDRRLGEKWRERLAPPLTITPDDLKANAVVRCPVHQAAVDLIEGMNKEQVERVLPLLDASTKLVKASG